MVLVELDNKTAASAKENALDYLTRVFEAVWFALRFGSLERAKMRLEKRFLGN